jgi:hypothetical protein
MRCVALSQVPASMKRRQLYIGRMIRGNPRGNLPGRVSIICSAIIELSPRKTHATFNPDENMGNSDGVRGIWWGLLVHLDLPKVLIEVFGSTSLVGRHAIRLTSADHNSRVCTKWTQVEMGTHNEHVIMCLQPRRQLWGSRYSRG